RDSFSKSPFNLSVSLLLKCDCRLISAYSLAHGNDIPFISHSGTSLETFARRRRGTLFQKMKKIALFLKKMEVWKTLFPDSNRPVF
ncbi:hypothetical protein, partial [Vibrio mexicanus]|uniref:hypothetical protein n=1 Tax=Vibrio mexicanus TaxID=1004326 RepID=UPI001EE388C9